jgi:8-oxo-dGTP diphosphatase
MVQNMGFDGAKVALFLGEKLIVILRDEAPDLSYAGYWDLPGGGREGEETPVECVAREWYEELGVLVVEGDVVWSRTFTHAVCDKGTVWFFVAQLPENVSAQVQFGDEGQRWTLMTMNAFLTHPKAVPAFQDRLKMWGGGKGPPAK